MPVPLGGAYEERGGPGSTREIVTNVGAGARSLRVVAVPDGANYAHSSLRRTFPAVTAGTIWTHGLYWLGPGVPPSSWGVLLELQGANTRDGERKVSVDLVTNDQLMAVSTIGARAGFTLPSALMPRERWACLELRVEMNAPRMSGQLEVFVNGASVLARTTGVDTTPPGGFTTAILGLGAISGITAPQELRLDDFVVSHARVGCR